MRFVTFIVIMCIGMGAWAQQRFTLEEAIHYALENNLNLKLIRLNESLDNASITQARLNLLPNLNGSVIQDNSYGRTINQTNNAYTQGSTHYENGSLNSQVTLFGGLQKINLIKQNKYQLLSDQSNTEKTKENLIIDVLNYYLQMLSYSDLVKSSQEKYKVSLQTLENSEKKYEVGTITESDVLQNRSQLDQDAQNVTNYQNDLNIAKTELLQRLNLDPAKPFDIAKPDSSDVGKIKTNYDPLDVYQQASKILPDVKIYSYLIQVNKAAIAVARGGLYPNLTLNGSLSTIYSGVYQTGVGTPTSVMGFPVYTQYKTTPFNQQLSNNLSKVFYFTLTIPIFNGWQQRLVVQRAKINYQGAILNEEIAKLNLNKILVQAVLDLRTAEKAYAAAKSSSQALAKSFFYSQQRYDVGLLNSLEYNLAKSNLTNAEANEIKARYDLIFKAKVVDFYLGNKITL